MENGWKVDGTGMEHGWKIDLQWSFRGYIELNHGILWDPLLTNGDTCTDDSFSSMERTSYPFLCKTLRRVLVLNLLDISKTSKTVHTFAYIYI